MITTFNAYLPFYEEVVLRRLVNEGMRNNVLLMDSGQFGQSMVAHPPRLAGRHYSLVPIRAPGAFHPKLMFLAGKKKVLIVIGSHNMTLAGFGFNRELTNVVRVQGPDDAEGCALASAVWVEIEHWLDHYGRHVPSDVSRMVRKVKDVAPWLKTAAETTGEVKLLAGRPDGQTLWQQLMEMQTGQATRVSMCGAFFDEEARMLRSVAEQLRPSEFKVAVDPATVQISAAAGTLTGVSLVRAQELGVTRDDEASRYLHAKGIFIESADGRALFASGSANPSAPAWMAENGWGNIELMLAVQNQRAREVASELGFDKIAGMSELDADDWQTIASNDQHRPESMAVGFKTGIVCTEGGHVIIPRSIVGEIKDPSFSLKAHDTDWSMQPSAATVHTDPMRLTFDPSELSKANVLEVASGGAVVARLTLHHVREIEEQARTGTQRQFKEALSGLSGDFPNLELLLTCLDKIIFSERREPAIQLRTAGRTENSDDNIAPDVPSTLRINVSDIKGRGTRTRLKHSPDFAYLLDLLIYELRRERSVEPLDKRGRSEEEQVDADDDLDPRDSSLHANSEELLALCHRKVSTMIGRMLNQLGEYAKTGDGSRLEQVLVRLLGVLAALRELRACDGRVPWVEQGKTTVPHVQRARLLDGILFGIIEGATSLVALNALGAEVEHSEDVARLKGLILWLAWDAGLTLQVDASFNETIDLRKERLVNNAKVLALAQMIEGDQLVVEEARRGFGAQGVTGGIWLSKIEALARKSVSLREQMPELPPSPSPRPGLMVAHCSDSGWRPRVVLECGDNKVRAIALSKKKPEIAYSIAQLAFAILE